MKKISISELRNNFKKTLDDMKPKEKIEIISRSKVVAVLIKIEEEK